MIPGCAPGPDAKTVASAVDVAAYRCPPVADSVRETLAAKVPAPKPPLDRTAVRGWIDAQDSMLERKTAAGTLLMREYETCRTGTVPGQDARAPEKKPTS